MPLTIDTITEARRWALEHFRLWKQQTWINDRIAADLWDVIHSDNTVEESEPLIENVYKVALEDKMASSAQPEPNLIVWPKRGTRKDMGEKSAAQRRRIHLSFAQRSEHPVRFRMKSYRDWYHAGAAYAMPWVDWFELGIDGSVTEAPATRRLPYFFRFDPRTAYPLAHNNRGQITEFMTIARRPIHELSQELGRDHPAIVELQNRRPGKGFDYQKDWLEEVWYFDTVWMARALVDPGLDTEFQSQLFTPTTFSDAGVSNPRGTAVWVTSPELHKLGRCPVVGAERVTHDDIQPRGAIEDIIPQLQIAQNFMRKLLDDLNLNIFSPVVVDGVVNPEDYGPNAILLGDGTGNARIQRDRPGVNFEAQQTVRQILEQVKSQAFQPQQRSGQAGASIISDRAVNSVQAQFNEELGWAMGDHEQMMAGLHSVTAQFDEVWCSPPEGETKVAEGIDGMQAFEEHYHPAEAFGGDYRVQVDYGPHRGLDLQNHLTALALMKNLNGLSTRSFMQRSGLVADALQEERDMAIEALIGRDGLFFGLILPQQIESGNLQAAIDFVNRIDGDNASVREAVFETIRQSLQPAPGGAGGPAGPPQAGDILRQVASLQAGGIPGQAEGLPLPGPELARALPGSQRRLAQAAG